MENELLVVIADALQGWNRGLSALGATEVLAWMEKSGRPAFAFRGDALRIERSVLIGGCAINNHNHSLEIDLQHQLGLPAEPWMRGNHVVGVRGGAGQLMTAGGVCVGEFFDAIESAINYLFETKGMEEVYSRVALMPREGSPWEYDEDETTYYTAKKKRWLKTPRPPWVEVVRMKSSITSEDIYVPGTDMCQVVDVVDGLPAENRMLSMSFDDPFESVILVTHSFDLERHAFNAQSMAQLFNDCGGLLFPSLAVGNLPAATFGPISYIIEPRVVLDALKPYRRGRGKWPINVYTTDAWTGVMTDFLGYGAAEMFQQLTGSWTPSIYGVQHFWVLGPPIDESRGPVEGSRVLNTRKLRTEVRRRMEVWGRELTAEQVEAFHGETTPERYPYFEAKSNAVIRVNNFAACTYPAAMRAEVEPFLQAIGFDGQAVPIDAEYEAADVGSMYRWSWAVQDTIASMGRSIEVAL